MTTCPSCGGIIGRDCFNPSECAAITQDMAARASVRENDNSAYVSLLCAIVALPAPYSSCRMPGCQCHSCRFTMVQDAARLLLNDTSAEKE